jgi:hypothetical protein
MFLAEFSVFRKKLERPVVCGFALFCKETARQLIFVSVIGNAFAAFAASYTGFIGAGANCQIFLHRAIHDYLLSIYCL